MIKTDSPMIGVGAWASLSALAVAAVTVPVLAQSLPEGNGKELVQTICTGCHDLSPITQSGGTRAAWEVAIKSMIDMGAKVTPEQVPVLAAYLAANFPPRTP